LSVAGIVLLTIVGSTIPNVLVFLSIQKTFRVVVLAAGCRGS
jgi:hypothetical protein